MLKKIAFGGVGLVLLAAPLFTSALTVQEQIAALMAQIQQLQLQITALSLSVSNTTTGDSDSSTGMKTTISIGGQERHYLSCNAVNRRLYRGLNGTDVANLQSLLFLEGLLPADSATGYFGFKTEAAVQLWQSTHGIISSGSPETTGWGVVGPQTHMAMLKPDCPEYGGGGNGGTSAPTISSSVSGSAVTITYANLPTNSYIQLINQSNSVVQSTLTPVSSGTGGITVSSVPAGTYILRVKQYVPGVDAIIAESSSFTVGGTAVTASITQTKDTTTSGDPYGISWSSTNATACTVDYTENGGLWKYWSSALSGTVTPQSTTGTYQARVTCTGAGGTTATQTITHTVTAGSGQNAPTLTMAVNPTTVSGVQSAAISWTSTNATECRLNGERIHLSDTIIDSPVSYTTVYTIICTGPGGSVTRSATITDATTSGTAVPTIQATPRSGAAPLAATFTISNSRGTADNGIYYTITFGDGQAGGFSRGGPFTLSHTYSSAGTYTATVKEATECGTWECIGPVTTIGTATVMVSAQPTTATPNSLPAVTTLAPSNVTATSVTLNGSVNSAGTTGTKGWFRASATNPGTCNDAFGIRSTSDTAFTSDYRAVPYSLVVSGLTPSTTYYYCAIGSNPYGGSYGSVMSFTTLATTNTTTTTSTTPTPSAAVSGSVSGNTVTATYANLPQNSYIQLVDQSTGNVQTTLASGISGSSNAVASSVPAGTYILRVKQYASGTDPLIIESSSFTVGGATTTTTTSASTPTPTATLTQSSSSSSAGTAYSITWGSTNATACTVAYTGPDGGATISSGPTSGGPQTFNTPTAGTYVATNTCTGAGGTASQSVTHTVTATAQPNSTPTVYTDAPTNVTATSVTLNGRVNSAGTTGTTGWFRADTTSPGTCNDTFGTRSGGTDTTFAAGYQAVPYSLAVTGLIPGTTYYYCAIASNPFGKNYGSVVSFSAPTASAGNLNQIANALTAIQAILDKLRSR